MKLGNPEDLYRDNDVVEADVREIVLLEKLREKGPLHERLPTVNDKKGYFSGQFNHFKWVSQPPSTLQKRDNPYAQDTEIYDPKNKDDVPRFVR
mmetsp:Transcript_35825/g.54910  ORF Transcript_35825/g.54910 Transcript_35825/m.54910 type:complete len:94 (+) Transcript_35825:1644-1925(+)